MFDDSVVDDHRAVVVVWAVMKWTSEKPTAAFSKAAVPPVVLDMRGTLVNEE